jgi:hypothetical protein
MSVPDHLLDPPDLPDPPECPQGHGPMEFNIDGADSYWYCDHEGCDEEIEPYTQADADEAKFDQERDERL